MVSRIILISICRSSSLDDGVLNDRFGDTNPNRSVSGTDRVSIAGLAGMVVKIVCCTLIV